MLHSISLCMIIKNEEQHLDECLHKIKDYVSEIIIIDTGSTDKSKEIARKYTDKIYDFTWCDDFAKARNYSISKATNDWILILDADEMILEVDKEKLTGFTALHSKEKVVGRIKIINLFEEGDEVKKSTTYVTRFFNKNFFHYKGPIHEQVVAKDNGEYKVKSIQITIEHLGYLDVIMNKKSKYERNITLLKSAIKDNGKDPYYHYQLGKSYYKAQQYKMALESFKNAISLCNNFRYEYAQDLVESYGYALLKCEKYLEAMNLLDYQNYYAKSPDYNFVVGLIYMNNGKFQEAIDTFKKCIGEIEGKVEGINSYQPKYNIGVIYEVLGEVGKAMQYYKECGDYLPAKKGLKKLLKHQIKGLVSDNELEKAKKILKKNKNILEDDVDTCAIGAVIAMMDGEMDKAEKILLKGLKFDGGNFNLLYNLAYVYHYTNNIDKAISYYEKALKNADNKINADEIYEVLETLR